MTIKVLKLRSGENVIADVSMESAFRFGPGGPPPGPDRFVLRRPCVYKLAHKSRPVFERWFPGTVESVDHFAISQTHVIISTDEVDPELLKAYGLHQDILYGSPKKQESAA